MSIERALISVYDKTGIVEFTRCLVDEFNTEIVSTGGTAKLLAENGIKVRLVEDLTGFPALLGDRVKTLHPAVHAAVLADRRRPLHVEDLERHSITPFDLVVVNLYPFVEAANQRDATVEKVIEMIDIGGPCLLRAAAKNHSNLAVVSDPSCYESVLEKLRDNRGELTESDRVELAWRAFETTRAYENAIADYFQHQSNCHRFESPALSLPANRKAWSLRYGENPHQQAAYYEAFGGGFSKVDHDPDDRAVSFNNLVDVDAATYLCLELSRELDTRAVFVFVKHTNACGVGMAAASDMTQIVAAYDRAYLGDVNAAMGGVLACSIPVDDAVAEAVMSSYDRIGRTGGAGGFFVEAFSAPSFSNDAVEIIRTRKPWGKRARLMALADGHSPRSFDIKSIAGGFLVQEHDNLGLGESEWKCVTKRAPSADELRDLRAAWLICKHTKSNAITICRDGMLLGSGTGQTSRVMSCRIATMQAEANGHGMALRGSAAASDAFFPFSDGPEILAEAGVTAIIQPGGSKRDEDTIAACNERDLTMIMSGARHFKH